MPEEINNFSTRCKYIDQLNVCASSILPRSMQTKWEGESSSGEMSNFCIEWTLIKEVAHHFAFTWIPKSFKTSTI